MRELRSIIPEKTEIPNGCWLLVLTGERGLREPERALRKGGYADEDELLANDFERGSGQN